MLSRSRNDRALAESELEQADKFDDQIIDVFNKSEHTQVPLPKSSDLFMEDIQVPTGGVTQLLRGWNPSRALEPDELHPRALKELAPE